MVIVGAPVWGMCWGNLWGEEEGAVGGFSRGGYAGVYHGKCLFDDVRSIERLCGGIHAGGCSVGVVCQGLVQDNICSGAFSMAVGHFSAGLQQEMSGYSA